MWGDRRQETGDRRNKAFLAAGIGFSKIDIDTEGTDFFRVKFITTVCFSLFS